jgi:hypothetical protein
MSLLWVMVNLGHLCWYESFRLERSVTRILNVAYELFGVKREKICRERQLLRATLRRVLFFSFRGVSASLVGSVTNIVTGNLKSSLSISLEGFNPSSHGFADGLRLATERLHHPSKSFRV